MDNILKLLLGVLGVAGLLAMLAPSQFTPTEPKPETVTEAPPATQAALPPIPENPTTPDSEPYNFKIGEPTLDGKPIVDPDQPLLTNADAQSKSTGNNEQPAPAQADTLPPSGNGGSQAPAT